VLLGNLGEHLVKIGPAIVSGRLEASEGVPAVSTVEDNVPDLVGLQTTSKEHADLEEVVNVFGFQSLQQILEPLEGLSGEGKREGRKKGSEKKRCHHRAGGVWE